MNRPAFRSSALRHGRPLFSRSTRPLSASAPRQDDDQPSGSARSAAAASELGSLNRAAPAPAVDARTLRAPTSSSSRVITVRHVRSLRGAPGRAQGPPRFGNRIGFRRSEGADASGPPSFRRTDSGGADGRVGRFAATGSRYEEDDKGSGGFRRRGDGRGGRGGRGGFGGFGGGRGGRSRGGSRRLKGREDEADDEEKERPDKAYAVSAQEEAYIDAMEQGVVMPYNPPTAVEAAAGLRGFGPAVATDVANGPAEAILRCMRVLGGARPWNPTSPFAHDVKDDFARYFGERKPLFYDSLAEKAWVESSREKFVVDPAPDVVRQAISNRAVLGKYEKPKFADLSNVAGLVAMYQAKTSTYTPKGEKMFQDTLLPLLSRQTGGGKARGRKTP